MGYTEFIKSWQASAKLLLKFRFFETRSLTMPFPPEVFLIGAQKAGTTTLAYLLSQHPNICVAKNKEPHFFLRTGIKV